MRKWFGQLADVQAAGVPQMAVDYLGVPVPAVNWPGGTSGRADTLQQNPSDSAAVFPFDDQSGDLSGTPGVVPEITSSVAGLAVTATGLQAEDPSLPATPQQFRWAEVDLVLDRQSGPPHTG